MTREARTTENKNEKSSKYKQTEEDSEDVVWKVV